MSEDDYNDLIEYMRRHMQKRHCFDVFIYNSNRSRYYVDETYFNTLYVDVLIEFRHLKKQPTKQLLKTIMLSEHIDKSWTLKTKVV